MSLLFPFYFQPFLQIGIEWRKRRLGDGDIAAASTEQVLDSWRWQSCRRPVWDRAADVRGEPTTVAASRAETHGRGRDYARWRRPATTQAPSTVSRSINRQSSSVSCLWAGRWLREVPVIWTLEHMLPCCTCTPGLDSGPNSYLLIFLGSAVGMAAARPCYIGPSATGVEI